MTHPAAGPPLEQQQLADYAETMLRLVLPPSCLPGVQAQLSALRDHAHRLLDDEPA